MAIDSNDDVEVGRRLAERFPSDEECCRVLAASVTASASALVETLGAFLVTAGMNSEDVAEVLRGVASEALKRDLRSEPESVDLWTQVSSAVSAWWRDPKYLNEAGEPNEIPELGPEPSIDALLRAHVNPGLHGHAKALLGRTAAKEANGRWRLEDRRGFLSVDGQEAVQRLHTSLSGMLSTFVDNQMRRREPPNLKNFDCMAIVHSFPVAALPEARAKIAARFPLVMHDVVRWLDGVAAQGHEGPVANVGVTVFMHSSQPANRVLRREPDSGRCHGGLDAPTCIGPN